MKPIACRRVAGANDLKRPGDFAWYIVSERDEDGTEQAARPIAAGERPTHLWYRNPFGTKGRVSIRPEILLNGHSWEWDGDLDRPTLSPSINEQPGGPWHGWIRAGVMTTV